MKIVDVIRQAANEQTGSTCLRQARIASGKAGNVIRTSHSSIDGDSQQRMEVLTWITAQLNSGLLVEILLPNRILQI
ncbi:hypothetical protein ACIPF8_20200 [Collimonas sp. NPDC087041]|uniref:hypothetical protein n=1 Tax=Collimonas sp. NPDC087041 TaxID=3363960 RepID=UPI0037F7CED3